MGNSNDDCSIADAARRLGVHRPRLSKLLDEAGVEKKKAGREVLVSYAEAQRVVQLAASEGRVRGSIAYPKPVSGDDKLLSYLEEQLRVSKDLNKALEIKVERLQDRVESLLAVETELKLLKAGKVQDERKGASASADIKTRAKKAFETLIGK